MKWFRVDSFFDVWRPVYRLQRIFSLNTMTYNFQDQSAERTSIDQTLLVVGILMLLQALYHTFAYFGNLMIVLTNSYIISTGRFGSLILVLVSHAESVISNYVFGYKIANFPKDIQKIDRQMARLFKHCWNYQAEHFEIVMFITLQYLEWLVASQIMPARMPTKGLTLIGLISIGVSFVWVNLGYNTKMYGLIITLAVIRRRFAVLNKSIRNFITNKERTKDPAELRTQLVRIALLHSQLSDIVVKFNQFYSITLMLTLGTGFGLTVFSSFTMIHAYAANVDESIFQVALSSLLFDIIFVAAVAYILIFCVLVNEECKKTAVLVHKIIGYHPFNQRLIVQLRRMSLQLNHHMPRISCRLFDFDAQLIFTVIGSFNTYLIILLQFDLVNYSQKITCGRHYGGHC